jgi:hypothetical protein
VKEHVRDVRTLECMLPSELRGEWMGWGDRPTLTTNDVSHFLSGALEIPGGTSSMATTKQMEWNA